MAMYIDVEKAKTFFEEIDAGSRAHTTLLTPYEFAEYLDEIPAADVVPKSEVDKLNNELMIWKQDRFNLYQRLELYEITRQKVAREIFEEIEDCMKGFEDDDDGYLLKKCEFEFFMRELKKKYTEDIE